jgi:hypothetical protein
MSLVRLHGDWTGYCDGRVHIAGLRQRGRQPIRRGVRGGSPALELCALLIRKSGHIVQNCPSRLVRWAVIPALYVPVRRRPVAWQQDWQQSRQPSVGPRPSVFRPDVSPVGADRASVHALPPVAAARRWLLLLLSPLLSAQREWWGAELLLGDHRRALGFPAVSLSQQTRKDRCSRVPDCYNGLNPPNC